VDRPVRPCEEDRRLGRLSISAHVVISEGWLDAINLFAIVLQPLPIRQPRIPCRCRSRSRCFQ
jgi:hypothetical protein